MTVSRFHVAGMDCAAEEQLVRMALSDIDQINRIDVDLDQRDVLIDHTTDTDTIDTALQTLNLGAEFVDDTSEIGPAPDTRANATR